MADPRAEQRVPVWNALSELFLDTELGKREDERIAKVLAESPYEVEKLEEILRFEVTPVLRANLPSVVGEWAGFDPDWLREKLTSRIDRQPLWRGWGVSRLVRGDWLAVRSLVEERRRERMSGRTEPEVTFRLGRLIRSAA